MELLQLTLYTISNGMFYTLLAIGFGFTLRSIKFFNISYGGALLVGGYVMFWLYRVLGISLPISLFTSLIASGVYSALSYEFIFKTLQKRKAKNLIFLIASFGLLIATSAILGMIFGSQTTVITRHLSDVGLINIFGANLNTIQVFNVVAVAVLIIAIASMRYKTQLGRAIRAMEDDAEVAELVGIPKEKIFLKIFFISGALAGLAGIILGLDTGIIPASGLIFILPTIVAAVIGGMRSFWGGILGGFTLSIAQQITIILFGGTWVQAVPFVILIIMLWVKPEGILQR